MKDRVLITALVLGTVTLVVAKAVASIKNSSASVSLSLRDTGNIVDFISRCVPDSLEYTCVFRDSKIYKAIMPRTWTQAVGGRGGVFDDDFMVGQESRFDVTTFDEIVRGVPFPETLDTIFSRMNYHSKYVLGASTFWVYDSGISESSPIMADIFRAHAMMMRLCRPDLRNRPHVFHIFLVDEPKKFTTASGGIVGTPSNVNSGRAIGKHVFVWRREEICKVFIHEMVHLLELDLGPDRERANRRLGGILGVRLHPGSISSAHEAYTETVTKVLYSSFLASVRGTGFSKEFEEQVGWAMEQCARVLHLNGVRSMSDLVIFQKTFMFEYYVLHAALLWDAYHRPDLGTYLNFVHENPWKRSHDSISRSLSHLDTTGFLLETQRRLDALPEDFGSSQEISLRMSA